MVRHSIETKVKAVIDVSEGGKSFRSVSKSLNIAKSAIHRWVTLYENFGVDGLALRLRTYTGDFKAHVVEYMQENSMSHSYTAAHFGIPGDQTVGNWERIYREKGPEALYKDNRGREREVSKDKIKEPKIDKQVEESLVAEVKRLRMENEYLKKLNALVRQKEVSKRKTRLK